MDIGGYERAIRSEIGPIQADTLAALAAKVGISNLEARVLGAHGPIRGLYAAGEITGTSAAARPTRSR